MLRLERKLKKKGEKNQTCNPTGQWATKGQSYACSDFLGNKLHQLGAD